jgi:hypothetical protein
MTAGSSPALRTRAATSSALASREPATAEPADVAGANNMTIMLLGGRRARPVHSASAHRRQLAGPVTGPASSDDDDDYDDGDSIESPASSTADSRGPDDPSWAAEPRIGVVGRGAGHNPRRQQVLAASLSSHEDDFGLPCKYANCDFVARPACTVWHTHTCTLMSACVHGYTLRVSS